MVKIKKENNMKHIKIEVKDLGKEWGKVLRIVEQTHRGYNFGDCNVTSFLHNDFGLYSVAIPSSIDPDILYVRGDNKTKDNLMICVPSEKWLQKVRETVRAYNKYFKDKALKQILENRFEVIEVIE